MLGANPFVLAGAIIGGGGAASSTASYETLVPYMNPKGLSMLISALLTIYVAIMEGDIIVATTNVLAGAAIVFAYTLPWTAGLLLASTLTKEASATFGDVVPVLTPIQLTP